MGSSTPDLYNYLILILLIFFIFSFLYFFFCQKIKYYQLKRKMQFSPRDFIIELYDNLRKILGFFGFAYANQPLLEYVTFIEEKTGIKNVFLKITNKFMEANYSNREIKLEEVVIFVKYYNNFLKGFIKKHNLITFLKKYCLVFFRKYIFFF